MFNILKKIGHNKKFIPNNTDIKNRINIYKEDLIKISTHPSRIFQI